MKSNLLQNNLRYFIISSIEYKKFHNISAIFSKFNIIMPVCKFNNFELF